MLPDGYTSFMIFNDAYLYSIYCLMQSFPTIVENLFFLSPETDSLVPIKCDLKQ